MEQRDERRRRVRSRKRSGSVLFLAAICCLFGSVLVGGLIASLFGGSLFCFFVPVAIGAAVALRLKTLGVNQSLQWQQEVTHAIETEDIEQIGSIVDLMGVRNRWGGFPGDADMQRRRQEMYAGMDEALIHMLPRLQDGDLALFTTEQRSILYQSLQGGDSYLVEAILTGLAQMDDRDAIPAITALANGQWKAQHDANLREAAQTALKQLLTNREQDQARQALLRASDTSDSAPDTLLHAVAAPEQAPEQLLRADAGNDGSAGSV